MKTILVTGGAGYLGSVLTPRLLAAGYRVKVVDSLMFGEASLAGLHDNPYFTLIEGDVRDVRLVEAALKGVFGVVHLAALVGEPACVVKPGSAREINVVATKQLAQLAAECRVERFIFASTCSNYGVTESTMPVDETFPLKPLSLYAETKVEAEQIVLESSLNCTTVLRLATLYGVSPRMRFNLLINELVRNVYLGRELVFYDLSSWRPFVDVSDAATAIMMVLEAPRLLIASRVFNVVGENLRRGDILKLVKQHFPFARIRLQRGNEPDRRNYWVSGRAFEKAVGFSCEQTIESGMLAIWEALESGLIHDLEDERYTVWVDKAKL